MKGLLKGIGGVLISVAVLIGLIFLAVFVVKGGVWLSGKLLPLFSKISAVLFFIFCIVLLPLAAFRKTRGWSGLLMYIFSSVFGATLWMWAFLLCYVIWGWAAVIVGLFIGGIGVVPIAIVATAIKGMWPVFWQLILSVVIVFGIAGFGAYLAEKAERRNAPWRTLDSRRPLVP